MNDLIRFSQLALCALLAATAAAGAWGQGNATRPGDYILAVVNEDLVTAGEVEMRVARARAQGARAGTRLPPEDEMRKQVLDALIEERVISTYARTSGAKVEEGEIDRAVQGTAAQNQLTVDQLRERLRLDGTDMPRFRSNMRDMILVERVREREVVLRIRVPDAEIDQFIAKQVAAAGKETNINLAQVLVTVPEGANEAVVQQRQARAEQALARIKAGESFDTVALQISEDGNKERGGAIGLRPASRLPDAFVEAVRGLKAGEVTPVLLRSGAGFHVLKVLDRREPDASKVTQTRARHVLLRVTPQLTAEVAARRLAEYRAQILAGQASFEELARKHSEDGSAPSGGDLGWASPGQFVPEFEEALNGLALNGISPPVASRFGVHLIQVVERRDIDQDPKQLRDQARNAIREQKFDDAYAEWAKELRARAYIEMREPPQ
jgi:peptidyl-prolyl cis-trans isomerase SurA